MAGDRSGSQRKYPDIGGLTPGARARTGIEVPMGWVSALSGGARYRCGPVSWVKGVPRVNSCNFKRPRGHGSMPFAWSRVDPKPALGYACALCTSVKLRRSPVNNCFQVRGNQAP